MLDEMESQVDGASLLALHQALGHDRVLCGPATIQAAH
jgi:hypothetical protein